ncbi:PepSY domain-containing protein [Streptomyces sp. NPDC020965]|uniref:PepSY domain-containing protein n=1 Tax=Streptomyces sp. NPDC020965 TaxID=3365105 RepID=UPI003795B8C1
MKRKIIVAVTVAALVGGGAFTAVAASGDDNPPASRISAAQAAESALKKAPGTVESVDRDDDGAGAWEVEVRTKDGGYQEVEVDAETGKVTGSWKDTDDTDDRDDRDDSDDRDDRDDRDAAAKATVNAEKATASALSFRPGTVTETEFDDGRWEIEVRAKDGREHDVRVDAKTGKASVSPDDDGDRDDDGADD